MFQVVKHVLITIFVVSAKTIIFSKSIRPHPKVIVLKYSVQKIAHLASQIILAKNVIQDTMSPVQDTARKLSHNIHVMNIAYPAIQQLIAYSASMDLISNLENAFQTIDHIQIVWSYFRQINAKFAPLDT